MATFNKFNSFVEALAEGVHNFASHTFKLALTNSAPVAGNTVLANITQISAGNGYTTGGITLTVSASSQTSGTWTGVIDDVVMTASGGSIASFQYAVIYNDTAASDELVAWYDHGSAISLADGESVTFDFTATPLQIA